MKPISNYKLSRSIAVAIIAATFVMGMFPAPANAMEYLQPKLYKVTAGTWGAAGAEMVVEKSFVTLTFDCANGEIPLILKKDRKGYFKVEGTYTRRGFGPIRINNPPIAQPVIYEGKVTGRSLKFKITVIATGDVVGEFTVVRGQEAKIRGCR
ncbi:MAG TPA: hypothetical protein PLL77_12850 [Pyrinomonadaceae bacterium]|nr:hypothetical protein [Pyrinomonadaceae bacterium]